MSFLFYEPPSEFPRRRFAPVIVVAAPPAYKGMGRRSIVEAWPEPPPDDLPRRRFAPLVIPRTTLSSGVVVFPLPWTLDAQLIEPGQDMTSPFGVGMQRVQRMGSRWSVTFSALPALGGANAQALVALRGLARANGLTMVFPMPQPAFTVAVGAPVINGAGQLGTQLIVSGFTGGAVIPAGTFFSFTSGGRTWLHVVTALATASGGGAATLAIAPMLRISTSGKESLNFATPSIEGFIQGRTEDWTLDMLAWVGLPSFTVMEPQ